MFDNKNVFNQLNDKIWFLILTKKKQNENSSLAKEIISFSKTQFSH